MTAHPESGPRPLPCPFGCKAKIRDAERPDGIPAIWHTYDKMCPLSDAEVLLSIWNARRSPPGEERPATVTFGVQDGLPIVTGTHDTDGHTVRVSQDEYDAMTAWIEELPRVLLRLEKAKAARRAAPAVPSEDPI